jgi:predicted nuclease of restriction endonuclease-like (RecB) superfamily
MDAPREYTNFIGTIRERIRSAQYEALKVVNKELVGLYWDIGKMISEKQEELGWGKSVIINLAQDLQVEFPQQKGFSARNLRSMVLFYTEYNDDAIWQTLSAKLSFSHNMVIIAKCKSKEERIFYLTASSKYGWSFRVLEHQIENKTFRRYLLGQTNEDNLPAEKYDKQRTLAIKDHYTFDFLGLSEKHSERELEASLIRNIQGFLLELGGELAFLGSQYKIELGGEEFIIDLLLYHRELQCLVAIELKT